MEIEIVEIINQISQLELDLTKILEKENRNNQYLKVVCCFLLC